MRIKIMIVLSVLVLVVLNYGIYKKEQIKKNGEIILLELAPVDPRSLIQGDCMRLRYAVERSALVKELPVYQKRGYMVIRPDKNKIAQFVRFQNKKALAKGERLLRFHKKYGMVKIVPDSFMFQEGHAKYYREAKYGIFKFNDSGKYLLVGLADKNREAIRVDEKNKKL